MIPNAPIADFAVILCQTVPSEKCKQKLFVVDKGTKGFEVTKLGGKLGIRASLMGEYYFNDVHVPASNLVSVEGMSFYHPVKFFDSAGWRWACRL